MTALPALLTLLGQAEAARDVAQADCRRAEAEAHAARCQVEQLLGYCSEYQQRWRAQFAERANIEIVRCYQGFMERLSRAIEQQERIAAQCEDERQLTRDALREREQHLASIRKLVERRRNDLARALARQEQRHADELATQAALHRPAPLLRVSR